MKSIGKARRPSPTSLPDINFDVLVVFIDFEIKRLIAGDGVIDLAQCLTDMFFAHFLRQPARDGINTQLAKPKGNGMEMRIFF